jgi:hypothetical protein
MDNTIDFQEFINSKTILHDDTMDNTIDFQEFINSKTVIHDDIIDNYFDGLKLLIKNSSKVDIITYDKINIILLFSVSECDKNGHYYFERTLEKNCDIVSDFSFESLNKNARMSLIIGDNEYDYNKIDPFIIVSSQYNEFKFKITFNEKPNINDKIKISYRCYIMNNDDRKLFVKNRIKTKTNIYSNGL